LRLMHTPVRYKLAEHPGDDDEAGAAGPKAGPAKLHPLTLTRDRDRERRGAAEELAVPNLPPPTSWMCRWTQQQLANNQQQATSPQLSERGLVAALGMALAPTPTRAAAQSPQQDAGGDQALRRSRSCPLVATFAAVPSSGEVAVQVVCCPTSGTAPTEGTADTGSWVPPTNRSWLPPVNTEGSLSPPCAGNRASRSSSAVIPLAGVGSADAGLHSGPPVLAQPPRRQSSCSALVQTGVAPQRQLSSRRLQSCTLVAGPDSARPGVPTSGDVPRHLSRHSTAAPRRAPMRQGVATVLDSVAGVGARKLCKETPALAQHLQQQRQPQQQHHHQQWAACMGPGAVVMPPELPHEQPVANPWAELSARHGVQAPCERCSSSRRLERPTNVAPTRSELPSSRGLSGHERSSSSSAVLEKPAVTGMGGNSSTTAAIAALRPELSARQGIQPSFERSHSSSCLAEKSSTRVVGRCVEPAMAGQQGRAATALTRSTSSSSFEMPPGACGSLHIEQPAGGLPSCQRSRSSSCRGQGPAAVVGNISQPAAAMTSRLEMSSTRKRGPPSCDRSCSPSNLPERSGVNGGTRIAARHLGIAGQLGKATASGSCLERPANSHSVEGVATSPAERSGSRPRLQAQTFPPARSCSPPHPWVAPIHQASLAPQVERVTSPLAIKRDSRFSRLDMPTATASVDRSASNSRLEVLVARTMDRSARSSRSEFAGKVAPCTLTQARPAGGAPPPAVRNPRVLSLR